MKRQILSAFCLFVVLSGWSSAARAEGFATPPDEPLVPRPSEDATDETRALAAESASDSRASPLRLHVGPSLLISEHDPQGGLFAAADIGRGATGARVSGTWVRVGSESGLSQYTLELWLDFARGANLHPVLAAGAGVARVYHAEPNGDPKANTLGVGVLRATLEYGLPIAGTDARAALDAIGALPAIQGGDSVKVDPWLTVVGSVGVGF